MAVFALVYGARFEGLLQWFELRAYDYFVVVRGEKTYPDSRVALIGGTEEDIARLEWPISDATMSDMLERLIALEPRAIGVDIYRDVPREPGHETLNALLEREHRIIFVWKYREGEQRGVAPPPVLAETDQIGFADVPLDGGGIVRRALLFMDDGQSVFFSFPLRLVLKYLEPAGITLQPGEPNPEHVRLGSVTVPPLESNVGSYVGVDAGGYQFMLDYEGGSGKFPMFSFSDVLDGKVPKDAIRNRILIIGVTAPSVKDYFHTPHSRVLAGQPMMYGIELHGHIAGQLLSMATHGKKPLATWSEAQELVWIALWAALGAVLGVWARGPLRFAVAVSGGMLPLAGVSYLLFLWGWWIPVVPALLAWFIALSFVAAHMAKVESRERGELMGLFSRYISGSVADNLWKSRDEFLEGNRPRSQKLIATVLFSDIRGFTTVSERLEPQQLMKWLNQYIAAMTPIVLNHGGIVNKFIGDAVMAIFGVPIARDNEWDIRADATNAVRCALEMRYKLEEMNPIWARNGLPEISIRVGVFTGELIAGSIGSAERLEYTVIGDTVNVAARLESYSGEGSAEPGVCRVLIGDMTKRYVGHKFALRRIGDIQLKGKQRPIEVFSVVGELGDESVRDTSERAA